jgi:hypothetical protein
VHWRGVRCVGYESDHGVADLVRDTV